MLNSNKKEIGRGAQAKVYLCDGFAYKCFNDNYPTEWVKYEISVQNEISKTSLPVVEYEATDDPRIIQMGYIEGISLAERMEKDNYPNGIEDMVSLQKSIHRIHKVKLPLLKDSISDSLSDFSLVDKKTLNKKPVNEVIEKAMRYLSEIPIGNSLCHLDFHFLNIMFRRKDSQYFIIDWINAKIGNPVFDFARTFVITNEFDQEMAQKYLSLVSSPDIEKAIYVMALDRLREHYNENTEMLLK